VQPPAQPESQPGPQPVPPPPAAAADPAKPPVVAAPATDGAVPAVNPAPAKAETPNAKKLKCPTASTTNCGGRNSALNRSQALMPCGGAPFVGLVCQEG
jgi:hypothetical protein